MGLNLIKRITHLSFCCKHSQRKGAREEIKAQKEGVIVRFMGVINFV